MGTINAGHPAQADHDHDQHPNHHFIQQADVRDRSSKFGRQLAKEDPPDNQEDVARGDHDRRWR